MTLRFFILISIFLSVIYAACGWVAFFLGTLLGWASFSIFLSSVFIFGVVMSYMVGDRIGNQTGNFKLKWVGGVAMGSLSIAFGLTILGWLALFFGAPVAKTALFVIVVTLGLGVLSLFLNQAQPIIEKTALKIGPQARSLRLVQLSDLHLNGLKTSSWTKHLVDQVNALKPDIIVFTGDLADVRKVHIVDHLSILKNLNAKTAKLAVSGNHDFYNGYDEFKTTISELGFTLIDNQTLPIDGLKFLGLSDKDGARFGVPRPQIQEILGGSNDSIPTLILDHRPEHFRENLPYCHFQLSGHTHAGQLPPWHILVWLRYRFRSGLYRVNQMPIYVSRGTGSWGPPMRLFRRSEIGCFDLTY